jgi:hypothetical protein
MYGLAAIHQADGFAMAGAGACIVLTGLAALSFLISMLPRITGLLDTQKVTESDQQTTPDKAVDKPIVPETLPDDVDAAGSIYMACTCDLGSDFSLVDLHRKAKEIGLPHPHLSITRFRDAGKLVPSGEGCFCWKPVSDQPNKD